MEHQITPVAILFWAGGLCGSACGYAPYYIMNVPSWWSRNCEEVKHCFLKVVHEHFSRDAESIQDALQFAEKAHQGQYRKGGGGPYIVHPLRSPSVLLKSGLWP